MPGARPFGVRIGDSAELFAEFIMGRLAFTTKAPRPEDIGHDFFCSIFERAGQLLKSGPFFTVQVKSKMEQLVYEKDYEIDWIKNQENPLLICIVDRKKLSIELFSTWNMLNAFLHKAAKRIILVPGSMNEEYKHPETDDQMFEQRIYLGKPILRISSSEAMEDAIIEKYSAVLRFWIKIDRENIVNKNAGMYWVFGPQEYETNSPFKDGAKFIISFFFNPQNLEKCQLNFGRCATALRVVVRQAIGIEGENKPNFKDMVKDLEQALQSHKEILEPLAKSVLLEHVGLSLE